MEIVIEICADKLRRICIDYRLYTRGTSEEYSEMLLKYDEAQVSVEELKWLALNIKEHSDTFMDTKSLMHLILTRGTDIYID